MWLYDTLRERKPEHGIKQRLGHELHPILAKVYTRSTTENKILQLAVSLFISLQEANEEQNKSEEKRMSELSAAVRA